MSKILILFLKASMSNERGCLFWSIILMKIHTHCSSQTWALNCVRKWKMANEGHIGPNISCLFCICFFRVILSSDQISLLFFVSIHVFIIFSLGILNLQSKISVSDPNVGLFFQLAKDYCFSIHNTRMSILKHWQN